jgi:hypothetical protein
MELRKFCFSICWSAFLTGGAPLADRARAGEAEMHHPKGRVIRSKDVWSMTSSVATHAMKSAGKDFLLWTKAKSAASEKLLPCFRDAGDRC